MLTLLSKDSIILEYIIQKKVKMNRPTSIVVTCILGVISGLIGILIGWVFVAGGQYSGVLVGEIEGGFVEQFALQRTFALGFIAIVWGAVELVAMYGMWKLREWGGYMAIVLSGVSIIASIILWSLLSFIYIIFGLLILILVFTSWRRLDPTIYSSSEETNSYSI